MCGCGRDKRKAFFLCEGTAAFFSAFALGHFRAFGSTKKVLSHGANTTAHALRFIVPRLRHTHAFISLTATLLFFIVPGAFCFPASRTQSKAYFGLDSLTLHIIFPHQYAHPTKFPRKHRRTFPST
jgi:hypothetical protein